MKGKLNLMAFPVAALVYGLCATAQATDTTITFNGHTAEYVAMGVGTEYVEGAYTYASYQTSGFFCDRTYKPESYYFDDDTIFLFTNDGPISFWRTDNQPFTAKSIRLGASASHSQAIIVGYIDGGGTVTNLIWGWRYQAMTNFLYGFNNITNLSIWANHSSDSIIDDITFTDDLTAIDAPDSAVLQFLDAASVDVGGFNYYSTVTLGVPWSDYKEKGFTMQPTAGGVYFKHNSASELYGTFDEALVMLWGAGSQLTITRDDGQPFNATSLIVGAAGDSALDLTGNISGGGTVTASFTPLSGTKTTESLSGFSNLTNLVVDLVSGAPVFDDLILEVYVPLSRGTVMMIR